MKIVVIGASGFVGTAVVERLRARKLGEVVPVVRGAGNAWRLARRGWKIELADLMNAQRMREVLSGATHVINCSRGSSEIMLRGLETLLRESRAAGVSKLVHLSSVAVYGDLPPPQSVDESAPTHPAAGSYGALKLQQDEMLAKATRGGLPAVTLCPPNITGPYSYFLVQLRDAIAQGRLAVVEEGSAPCNVVDVSNLAYAVERALLSDVIDGRRLFVTDAEPVTWGGVIAGIRATLPAGSPRPVPISRVKLAAASTVEPRKATVQRSLKHLVSGDVRAAIRQDPLLGKLEKGAKDLVRKLPDAAVQRITRALEGPITVRRLSSEPGYDVRLSAQQLRGVRHSYARATADIGYAPIITFAESMQAFAAWHSALCQSRESGFDILEELAVT